MLIISEGKWVNKMCAKSNLKLKKTAAFVAFAPDYRVLFLISLNLPEKIYIYSKNVKFRVQITFSCARYSTLDIICSKIRCEFLFVDLLDVCEVISNCGSL